ncbi:MAG: DnaJ domain-containing protein [Candidatus Aegiribacteria sp.]|nr:DnaJ domain-containing protein [Candidatus Aegiribacteria sp.]
MPDSKESSKQDFYEILGVKYKVTQEEIENAYHDLARKLHPDVTGGDAELTERYMAINEAYQVLSKPHTRMEYDVSIGIDKLSDGEEKKPESVYGKDETPGADMRRLDAKLRRTIKEAERQCSRDNFWEASRSLEMFLKTHPENPHLRTTLASAALGMKRYHDAANHMKVACTVAYHDPENFVKLGNIYILAGQLVLAEKALHEALGWNAEHVGALNLLKDIEELRDAEKPPIQRMFRKVAKAFGRKE